MDKPELVARILQAEGRGLTMIFCRTKRAAQRVADELAERGFASAAVHGDLGQGAREQALRAFRSGKVDVLAATDVAARGIDVDGVTHVINYECPEDEKTYLHRVGRTGRAGASGVAVTFVDWRDVPRWQLIDKALGLPFKDPIETYSSSEHVYTGLGIPANATGTLPKSSRTRAGLGAEAVEDLGETGKSRSRAGSGGAGGSGGTKSRNLKSSSAPKSQSTSKAHSTSKASSTSQSQTSKSDADTKKSPRNRDRSRTRSRSGKPVEGAE